MNDPRERRCLRSEDTRTALSYQLAYSAVQSGMDGLVLADNQGLLLASSPTTRRPEEIAACGPLALDPDEPLGPGMGARDDVTVQCFDFDGARLFLVGLGGMVSHRAVALIRAMRGVCRILRTTIVSPVEATAASAS
ncbi:MAG: hypothetical protein HY905_06985 [Deltaproteobacteria bacterium]|nr:hypothetical protein [Deltaproteobacteria bacterium]